MDQYCPKCFSAQLTLETSSIVHVVINEMQMDAGRILFNANQKKMVFISNLMTKFETFFHWYQSLQNKTPIKSVKVFSSDYRCVNNCSLRDTKISIVNDLVSQEEVLGMLNKLAENYAVTLQLSDGDIT